VSLTKTSEGTRVVWTSELEVLVPLLGRLLEPMVAAKFNAGFRAMLREMERRAKR
jgi:hypothetical protein